MSGAAWHPGIRSFGFDDGKPAAGPAPISCCATEPPAMLHHLDLRGCIHDREQRAQFRSGGFRREAPGSNARICREQVILFHGRYRRRKFWLLSLAAALLIFILPPLAAVSNPKGGGGAVALFVMALPSCGSMAKLASPTAARSRLAGLVVPGVRPAAHIHVQEIVRHL